jgi:hypothetical protein
MPEMDKDVVIPVKLLEIPARLPGIGDIGDEIVGKGSLGESHIQGDALHLGFLLATNDGQSRHRDEYPETISPQHDDPPKNVDGEIIVEPPPPVNYNFDIPFYPERISSIWCGLWEKKG